MTKALLGLLLIISVQFRSIRTCNLGKCEGDDCSQDTTVPMWTAISEVVSVTTPDEETTTEATTTTLGPPPVHLDEKAYCKDGVCHVVTRYSLTDLMTYEAAKSYCASLDSHLPILKTWDVLVYTSMITLNHNKYAWIGMTCTSNWHDVVEGCKWDDGSPVDVLDEDDTWVYLKHSGFKLREKNSEHYKFTFTGTYYGLVDTASTDTSYVICMSSYSDRYSTLPPPEAPTVPETGYELWCDYGYCYSFGPWCEDGICYTFTKPTQFGSWTYEKAKEECEVHGYTLPIIKTENIFWALYYSNVRDRAFLGMTCPYGARYDDFNERCSWDDGTPVEREPGTYYLKNTELRWDSSYSREYILWIRGSIPQISYTDARSLVCMATYHMD